MLCKLILFLFIATVLFYPPVTIYPLLLVDFLTPWTLFESKVFERYHNFLLASMPEREEIPLPELDAETLTREQLLQATNGYTRPVVIRGALKGSAAVEHWGSKAWWLEHYPDERVLCGYVDRTEKNPFCTVRDFFEAIERGEPFYISGGSSIFDRNPDLRAMVDTPVLTEKVEMDDERVSTQIFMGLPDMGSDLHSAIGCNVFRQMAGRKKWWFVNPSWTAYLYPSININGFSCHTKTLIGKGGDEPSPWLSKLERYTAILNPGDALINPPWYWHAIHNLPDENESESDNLVIGVPTRYGGPECVKAALRSDPVLSLVAFGKIIKDYGSAENFRKRGLEEGIAENRVHKEFLKEGTDPMEK
jgi:hypothetical protein